MIKDICTVLLMIMIGFLCFKAVEARQEELKQMEQLNESQ